MSDGHRGPKHSDDCRSLWDRSVCAESCPHTGWLDETVPRWQARAELLKELEAWSRKQIALQVADIERLPNRVGVSDGALESLRYAMQSSTSIVQQHYQQLALSAANQRRECDSRKVKAEEDRAAMAGPRVRHRLMEEPPRPPAVVTVAVQESLL